MVPRNSRRLALQPKATRLDYPGTLSKYHNMHVIIVFVQKVPLLEVVVVDLKSRGSCKLRWEMGEHGTKALLLRIRANVTI